MVTFINQVKLAKAKTNAYRKNYQWKSRTSGGVRPDLFGSRYADYYIGSGFKGAYRSPQGYYIQKNPISGKNEMYVRGTAKPREWLSNFVEALPNWAQSSLHLGGVSKYSRAKRAQYAAKLSQIAKRKRVSAVYGHSRGAAVVSDMKVGNKVKRTGVDGAFVLTDKGRAKGMKNYRQKNLFDAAIGLRAPKTVYARKGKAFHKAWT